MEEGRIPLAFMDVLSSSVFRHALVQLIDLLEVGVYLSLLGAVDLCLHGRVDGPHVEGSCGSVDGGCGGYLLYLQGVSTLSRLSCSAQRLSRELLRRPSWFNRWQTC